MDVDLLSLVEAAYRVELPEEEWLAGIVNAGNSLFDDGLGTASYVYSIDDAVATAEPVITRLSLGGPFDPSWLADFQQRIGERGGHGLLAHHSFSCFQRRDGQRLVHII